jgi:hypothetical protein
MFPMALEGALKLKEISYIHAEAYASGELKHGPIALVDNNLPVVVLAPRDALFDKTVSNMQEVMARDGKVWLISDADGVRRRGRRLGHADHAHGRPDLRPHALRGAGAADRLSHRAAQGHGCGPAAQPREIRDGGMTPEAALATLRAEADPERAAQMRAYHKADRPIWACTNGR